jgi:hypothetical protein
MDPRDAKTPQSVRGPCDHRPDSGDMASAFAASLHFSAISFGLPGTHHSRMRNLFIQSRYFSMNNRDTYRGNSRLWLWKVNTI